ncbi:MAG: sporulation protein [Ruminococcaceae bacterium]|nr:sporulation protein [Oscillospiraceae bacterium]
MAYETGNFSALPHRLELEGRERLQVSGVEDVERFDEQCIVMTTNGGTLVVSGEGLHIGKLSLDGGELQVDGRIDNLAYEDAPAPKGGSLLRRLLG